MRYLRRLSCYWPIRLVCQFICRSTRPHGTNKKVEEGIMFLTLPSCLSVHLLLRRVSCFWLFRLVCLFICHKLLSVAQQDHMGHTTKLKRVSCFWPFPLVCLFICHKLFSVAQQDHMGHNKVKEGIMFLTLLSVLLTVTTLCYLTREREHSFL